jgi:hypothetical protein
MGTRPYTVVDVAAEAIRAAFAGRIRLHAEAGEPRERRGNATAWGCSAADKQDDKNKGLSRNSEDCNRAASAAIHREGETQQGHATISLTNRASQLTNLK